MYDFTELKTKLKQATEWLQGEFAGLRTSRATPALLDSIQVEAYGSKMSIKEVANIITEDAKSIRVEPWDSSLSKSIEKAIVTSNLGLSTSPFEKGVRIIFPELTTERREQLTRLAKQKTEEAKVTIRGIRDKVWNDIQEQEKKGGMGEDDKFRLKDDMQKLVDDANGSLSEILEKKIVEIQK
ncbi:MAG: ribosome recycling factor [Patescibacteria group bacterium]